MKWPLHTSSEILDIRDGTHDSPKYIQEGFPLITSKNLVKGTINFDAVNLISEEDYTKINKRSKVDIGDILYSMIGSIGNYALIKDEPSYAVKNVAIFKFKDERLFNGYFIHLLNSPWIIRQMQSSSRGGTQKFVSLKILRNLKIPLPPLPIQKQIAEILDTADALWRATEAQLSDLDALAQSVFLEMFVENKDFRLVKIKNIASKEKYSLSSGPFGSNLTSKHYTSEGVVILRGTNITSGQLNLENIKYVSEEKAVELKRSEIKPDDLVIIAVGSSGKALKVPKELKRAIISQNFNKVSPNLNIVNPDYLEHTINSQFVQRQFRKQVTDTVRTFLSLTKIKEIEIPLPPIELQAQFAQIIENIEAQKAELTQSLKESEDLFNGLLQEVFG